MTHRSRNKKNRKQLAVEQLDQRIVLDGAGFIPATFIGPSAYLSEADTPDNFLPVQDCDECVTGIETFEDESLDFGITIDQGEIIGPGFSTGLDNLTDSVDGDDGTIDGTGQSGNGGHSYFTFGNTLTITFPEIMQSAGLVWTDADTASTNVIFEAFDQDGNSLGIVDAGDIADDSIMGTTAEDRFFGILYGDGVDTGVASIEIRNVGGSGIEIDHIQFANCSLCCDEIDLELTKTVDDDVVEVGDTVSWTVTIENNPATAEVAATGVQISDLLPAGLTLQSVALTNGSYTAATGTWTLIGPLDPGETETLTLTTTVNPGFVGGDMIVNVAEVSAADQLDIDSVPGNDDGDQSEDDEDSAKITIEQPVELLSLSGFSYVDVNNDGIFQDTELPLLGVEIQLMGTDINGNDVNLTTFTNSDGFYEFNDLVPGDYMVTQTQPVQFVDGIDTLGNLGGDGTVNDKFTVDLTDDAVEYNFGELGLLPQFVNKRFYLVSTPYNQWEFIDVREASVWHSFDVDHATLLDLNVTMFSGNATFTIRDANMNVVAQRGAGVLSSTIDPIVLNGEGEFFLEVSGDGIVDSLAMEFTAPTIEQTGSMVVAVATPGDDVVVLHLGIDGEDHVLNINGLEFIYDSSEVNQFNIGSSTGHDSIIVHGTELDDKGNVLETRGKLNSSEYSVNTFTFDNVTFHGGGGYDYTKVFGSNGDDLFAGLPEDSKLTMDDGTIHMLGFDRVDAYGRGGHDYASVYGTQGNDVYYARDAYALLQGQGLMNYTKGFERVDAFGRGGTDTAKLFDSAGNDQFVASPVYAYLISAHRTSYTKGFENVDAISSLGGYDRAVFFDGEAADETFVSRPDDAHMTNGVYTNVATGFDKVRAYSSGNDFAVIEGLKTGDDMYAYDNIASLQSADRDDEAKGFGLVILLAEAGQQPTGHLSDIDYVLSEDIDWA